MRGSRNCGICTARVQSAQTEDAIPAPLRSKRAACGLPALPQETACYATCLKQMYTEVQAVAHARPATRSMTHFNTSRKRAAPKSELAQLGEPYCCSMAYMHSRLVEKNISHCRSQCVHMPCMFHACSCAGCPASLLQTKRSRCADAGK